MRHLNWLLPLIALLVFAPFSTAIDLDVSEYFYRDEQFSNSAFVTLVYKYGELPGLILGGGATLLLGALFTFSVSTEIPTEKVNKALLGLSYFVRRFKHWRKAAAAITLAFFIGPGLLVSLGFKEHWGRPRPRQVQEFGGNQAFRPFYTPAPSWNEDSFKSFPSGHVSMGALFLCLCLVGIREKNLAMAWIGLLLAVGLIFALSYARIAIGGHFVSDAVGAVLIVWWVSLASCRIIYGPDE